MRQVNFLLIILILSTSSACYRTNKPDKDSTTTIVKEKPVTTASVDSLRNEYMVMGILYHQISGEYRALCYQAYNFGKILLDKDLADKSIDKHRAIVLDIDETVIDNSAYQAQMVLSSYNYPTRWDEWCNKAAAEAIPGALEFLNYAKMNGVSVFYVTNRKEQYKQVTIENLKKLGFPFADEEHVIMRTAEKSKEGRRADILQKHHISLLFGDNLLDFSAIFDDKTNQEKVDITDQIRAQFGSRMIILPNAMYGEWESDLYEANLPDSTKRDIRRKLLRGF